MGGEAGEGDRRFGIEKLRGGSGDDDLSLPDAPRGVLYGGPGNDRLTGSDGPDVLWGEGGNDTLIVLQGGDEYRGGAGTDTADFSIWQIGPIVVDLDGVADDGTAARGVSTESDNVFADVENVFGTQADDVITGSGANNRLVGNGGNDVLTGLGGDDVLLGGEGNDDLRDTQGTNVLDGGAGLDTVNGVRETADMPVFEAETALVYGGAVSRSIAGFFGWGYVDYRHASGDYVAFFPSVPAAGTYALSFRYANGSSADRPLQLRVNDQISIPLSFPRTGSWDRWATVSVEAPLRTGPNLVDLTAIGRSGPNLDRMSLQSRALQAEDVTTSGAAVRADSPGFEGAGYADYRHATRDYVEWPVMVAETGLYRLDFRYANGGTYDRPLDLSVNGQVVARLSFGPTGSWRSWRTLTPSVLLTAGRHAVRLTAAGQSGPNVDRIAVLRAE